MFPLQQFAIFIFNFLFSIKPSNRCCDRYLVSSIFQCPLLPPKVLVMQEGYFLCLPLRGTCFVFPPSFLSFHSTCFSASGVLSFKQKKENKRGAEEGAQTRASLRPKVANNSDQGWSSLLGAGRNPNEVCVILEKCTQRELEYSRLGGVMEGCRCLYKLAAGLQKGDEVGWEEREC